MDLFEEKDREKEEKKIFTSRYEKNMKILRIVMVSVFGVLGFVFLLLGAIFITFVEQTAAITFFILGGIYAIVAIIMFIVTQNIDADKAYERYKNRVKDGKQIYTTYEMSMRIILLEKRVKELEEEIESIKKNRN